MFFSNFYACVALDILGPKSILRSSLMYVLLTTSACGYARKKSTVRVLPFVQKNYGQYWSYCKPGNHRGIHVHSMGIQAGLVFVREMIQQVWHPHYLCAN